MMRAVAGDLLPRRACLLRHATVERLGTGAFDSLALNIVQLETRIRERRKSKGGDDAVLCFDRARRFWPVVYDCEFSF
jgi:hypothetical protein